MTYRKFDNGLLYHAKVEDVYPCLADGTFVLAHIDGPYALGVDHWDKMKTADLPKWYAPHIQEWGRVLTASASIYHWGTAEGWAAVHPVYLENGWTFRALITWDKGIGYLAGKIDTKGMRTWPNTTEVCALYQREPCEIDLWNEWGTAHPVRLYLDDARKAARLSLKDIDALLGTSDMARHWFTWSQWTLPSEKRYAQLQQHLSLGRTLQDLQKEHTGLWQEYRTQWERIRVPFDLPVGLTNVWRENQVQGYARLRSPNGKPLHPCQKPDIFAERMVRASSRPGDSVFEPFGGTCRIAAACENIARADPKDIRSYVCVEMDERYVQAVDASLQTACTRREG